MTTNIVTTRDDKLIYKLNTNKIQKKMRLNYPRLSESLSCIKDVQKLFSANVFEGQLFLLLRKVSQAFPFTINKSGGSDNAI